MMIIVKCIQSYISSSELDINTTVSCHILMNSYLCLYPHLQIYFHLKTPQNSHYNLCLYHLLCQCHPELWKFQNDEILGR